MAPEHFPHDAAYKAFFGNPDMVKSLLLDFVPDDLIRDFNFDTLEACSGSYTSVDLRQRHDDIVWRLRWKDTWCYIYILLEFQSVQDYWMALRIATYTGLLWQELISNGLVKTGQKLPPVLPIVLYNGDTPWSAPLNVEALVEPIHSKLSKYQLSQEYFLLDENMISKFLLDNAKGEAGYIFRLERAEDVESIMSIYHEFMGKISDEKFDFLRRAIKIWLLKLIRRKNIIAPKDGDDPEEDNIMLEQKFRRWEQEFIQKGKAEGRAEGRAEGLSTQKTTLFEMLSKRFGEIPAGWMDAINSITNPATISQLTVSMLNVNSQEEFANLLYQYPGSSF